MSEPVRLRIAIERLSSADTLHYAIWVVEAPYPGGYVHHDRPWPDELTQAWQNWRQFFSLRGLANVPHVPSAYIPPFLSSNLIRDTSGSVQGYTGRAMQTLGVRLWQWLFNGAIRGSLDQSLGIAMGQGNPLSLRLDIRDPELIPLPWEIMQPQTGLQAMSLSEHIRFSRTTSHVDPLANIALDHSLQTLLVLGEPDVPSEDTGPRDRSEMLQLETEAQTLKRILQGDISSENGSRVATVPSQVDVLVCPSAKELLQALERGQYNVFFYAGHGVPGPDGGLLFLKGRSTLNGTELAQVLTRRRVKLAVFNTCWGAQPDHQSAQKTMPRSSLAEVLLHHGVPAVLAMRDSIADEEALSFIQVFSRALAERSPVDRAIALARQHLLTLYSFNQPAWTLPVLYLHPDFDSQFLAIQETEITRIPGEASQNRPIAALRSTTDPNLIWYLYGGTLRVGRRPGNDVVVTEPWVSGSHAEIFCRQVSGGGGTVQTAYYLRDDSRFGTFCQEPEGWQHIHRQEVSLEPGTRLRFGSPDGQLMEFVIEG